MWCGESLLLESIPEGVGEEVEGLFTVREPQHGDGILNTPVTNRNIGTRVLNPGIPKVRLPFYCNHLNNITILVSVASTCCFTVEVQVV